MTLSDKIRNLADEEYRKNHIDAAVALYDAAEILIGTCSLSQYENMVIVKNLEIEKLQSEIFKAFDDPEKLDVEFLYKTMASTLNKRMSEYNNLIFELRRSASYYDLICKAIEGDEMLQDAWREFIMTLKLRTDTDIPGLTSPE